jgi:hypothetical protein
MGTTMTIETRIQTNRIIMSRKFYPSCGASASLDTVNGAQRRATAPLTMRQNPIGADLKRAEFRFGSKGLIGSARTMQ